MIKYGSLEWAVDLLKDCVANATKIEMAPKETQKAAKKIGLTDYYQYHIKVLTEEICNGSYCSQDSEEYKRTHKED